MGFELKLIYINTRAACGHMHNNSNTALGRAAPPVGPTLVPPSGRGGWEWCLGPACRPGSGSLLRFVMATWDFHSFANLSEMC